MRTKYAAIVTYTTGEKTGAVVCAESLAHAWALLLEEFSGGEHLQSVWLSPVMTPAHDIA